jgi:hypothetical protein
MTRMANARRPARSDTTTPVARAVDHVTDVAGLRAQARRHWARGEVRAALDPYERAVTLRDDPELHAEYLSAVRQWGRSAVLRPAWRATFQAGTPGRRDGTRLGGLPARPAGDPWPQCAHHRAPLGFAGQLNLNDPPGVTAAGAYDLLLLFRCRACAGGEERPAGAAGHAVELRRSEALAEERLCAAEDVPPQPAWEALREAGATFEPAFDLPDWQDVAPADRPHVLAMLGVTRPKDAYDAYVCAHQERFGGGGNLFASKIGGWPHWLERAAAPQCPACARPARFIAQLDSAPDLGLDWGRSGCAYVWACAEGCAPRAGVLLMQSM